MSLMQPRCAGATLAQGKYPPDRCQRCGATNTEQCVDDEAYEAQIATAEPVANRSVYNADGDLIRIVIPVEREARR